MNVRKIITSLNEGGDWMNILKLIVASIGGILAQAGLEKLLKVKK